MSAPYSTASHRGSSYGFTLVEMVITLTVFVLLSAMIFGIITGVLSSAGSLQDNQNRADQNMALESFLKKRLTELPSQSVLISYRRGDGEGLDQNGVILGTDDLRSAIDAKIQPNGLYTLRIATFSSGGNLANSSAFDQAVSGNDSSLSWTPLVTDIKTISWKFRDANVPRWVDQWDGLSTKPDLIEVTVQIAGDLHPSVMDFWLPHISNPPAPVLPTPAANGT
jgi:prepilin-type N-terminal cleavage/methylation domain-containing protein